MLSEQRIRHYRTFGFAVMRKVLRRGEIPLCAAELERALDAAYAHKPFDGTRKQVVTAMGPETPFMASLLEDPRMLGPAQQLGGDVLGLISDVNRRVGDTPWHPDADADFPCGVKFAWILEPVGSPQRRPAPDSRLAPESPPRRPVVAAVSLPAARRAAEGPGSRGSRPCLRGRGRRRSGLRPAGLAFERGGSRRPQAVHAVLPRRPEDAPPGGLGAEICRRGGAHPRKPRPRRPAVVRPRVGRQPGPQPQAPALDRVAEEARFL